MAAVSPVTSKRFQINLVDLKNLAFHALFAGVAAGALYFCNNVGMIQDDLPPYIAVFVPILVNLIRRWASGITQ